MKKTLEEELSSRLIADRGDFITRTAQDLILDLLYCDFHNEGHNLQCNTEANDYIWLARILGKRATRPGSTTDEVRKDYEDRANVAIECLPALMSRISSRCIRYSQALNTIITARREVAKRRLRRRNANHEPD